MVNITPVAVVLAKVEITFGIDKFLATTRLDGTIGLPGGKADPGETIFECAVRESKEEGWELGFRDKKKLEDCCHIVHTEIIDEKYEVNWVYVEFDYATQLFQYKEKSRGIKPILITEIELIKSGRSNDVAFFKLEEFLSQKLS